MVKARILIVEDERIIAIDLQRRLSELGYDVLQPSASGEDAVTRARLESPDLAIVDIVLSGEMDGIEAAERIKAENGIPIVFLTAFSDDFTLARAKAIEPYGFILKPFKEKELFSTIDIAIYKAGIENELRRQERWLAAILDSVEDAIIASDTENRIRFMNPMAESLTGISQDEARGEPWDRVLVIRSEKTMEPISIAGTGGESIGKPLVIENAFMERDDGTLVRLAGSVALIRDRHGSVEGKVLAFRDTSKIREISDRLSYQERHDALTGLINRHEFGRILALAMEESVSNGVVYFDIDQFKLINDTYGQSAGDETLKLVTEILKKVVRTSDICARLGGDEFAVLLRGAGLESTNVIAKRLQESLNSEKITRQGNVFTLNASIGLVIVDASYDDFQTILANADDACRLAKEEGGNRVRVYEPTSTMFRRRRGEMEWIGRLKRALEEDSFTLYFQPIIPLNDPSAPEKLEILIRMIGPDSSIIMPADFLPAAERYNLMPAIDRWVIESTAEEYIRQARLYGDDLGGRIFCINLSAASLTDSSFPAFITDLFTVSGIPPAAFCFEITETAAITNMVSVTQLIHDLRKMGCTFALDDFGSGFSSFNYLRNLPVDYLKIDGMFVRDMDTDTVNRAMVEAIHNLGRMMNIKTIAEFVSNRAIRVLLQELGVDYAQGYDIARPAPLSEYGRTPASAEH